MFLVNTYLKNNKMWGIYRCKVYKINWGELEDFTEYLSNEFEYKDNVLQISFWSWTWFNRIKQHIEDTLGVWNFKIYDISF